MVKSRQGRLGNGERETPRVQLELGVAGCARGFMFVGVQRQARIWEGQIGISHCH